MYGFMDIVCVGLIMHEGSSVYRIFKRWQAVNQQWKVLNYDKAKDLGNPVGCSSKAAAQAEGNFSDGVTDSGRTTSRYVRTILNHHCGYAILHILSQLRASNLSGSNQEMVMRVTTV
ncbi:E3 ubiquitin-protein ligase MARCH9 [Austrofundulus limnaeus]|uniref:E3 ubiquitin-protein ligase MARCH9 n=1 Tax=Austrofundulus limnaeus TaxID=52670 RepID=A0A2I4D8T0_AUSLI|nr:PREDICTED: E3 ubiquitin-protein ligase MARCH9-like [Austrofundulus limnaeus]